MMPITTEVITTHATIQKRRKGSPKT
jgi:hypothetical protein